MESRRHYAGPKTSGEKKASHDFILDQHIQCVSIHWPKCLFMDHQQTSLVVLNRFYHLSKSPTPLYCIYIVWQVLKIFLIIIHKIQPSSSFNSYCFTLVFTSADIIFHKFLELHSALSEKSFFHEFSFFNRFTQTPTL